MGRSALIWLLSPTGRAQALLGEVSWVMQKGVFVYGFNHTDFRPAEEGAEFVKGALGPVNIGEEVTRIREMPGMCRVRVRYRCWDAEAVEQAIHVETERAKEGRDRTLHDGRKVLLVQDDSMIAGMVFKSLHNGKVLEVETGNFEEQFWGMTGRILKRMKDTEEARVELAQAQVQEAMAQVEAVMAVWCSRAAT